MLSLKRKTNHLDLVYMQEKYQQDFSLDKLNFFRLNKLYRLERHKLVEGYLFYILDLWIKENYEETLKFANKLKKYIRKLRLNLNLVEKDRLLILDERIFSVDRHIKHLEVNADLLHKESAGAKFTSAKLYNKSDDFITEGTLIITNKRILFEKNEEKWNFTYASSKITPTADGLVIAKGKANFIIRIHDQVTLQNTFYNLIKKRKVKY